MPHHEPTEFPQPTYQEAVEGWQRCQAENARLQARVEEAELSYNVTSTLLSEAVTERDGYKALAERRKRALRPFAEAYYSSARTLRGDRAMSAVVQSHRVGLLSEQSDGQFGYLPIKAFRNARAAYDAIPEEEKE